MDKVHRIYSLMDPKPQELLDNPSRRFIKQGPTILYNQKEKKKKDRHFFLFNDVLLIAKRKDTAALKYRLRVYITLREAIQVVDVEDGPDPTEFRIIAPTKTFVLFGRNKAEKKQWIQWITNTIKKKPLDWDPENGQQQQQQSQAGGKKKGGTHKKAAKPVAESSDSDDDENVNSSGRDSDSEEGDEGSADDGVSGAEPSLPDVEEASGDDSDDSDAEIINPDDQSFVPVLPDQFFTPSSALTGTRAGKERAVLTGAAAKRKAARGNKAAAAGTSNGTAAPAASTAKKGGGPRKADQPPPQQQSNNTSSLLGDLLSFDDPNPQQPQQPSQSSMFAANPFGGAPPAATLAPAVAMQNPFGGFGGGAPPVNPFGGGGAPPVNPFGGGGVGVGGFMGMQQQQPQANFFGGGGVGVGGFTGQGFARTAPQQHSSPVSVPDPNSIDSLFGVGSSSGGGNTNNTNTDAASQNPFF